MEPIRLFFSYSHQDEKWLVELRKHLSVPRRLGKIDDWHDRKIGAGNELERSIAEALNNADIILLLISHHFLYSDFCNREMERAMERYTLKEVEVIPIILTPVDWHGAQFDKLLVLPKDGKPVTSWDNR